MKKTYIVSLLAVLMLCSCNQLIDRQSVVERNNPHVAAFDTLASLTVGNGGFAMTVDATGLQTFPEMYAKGIPLGTMSDWGWHSFPDTVGYSFDEVLVDGYACQLKDPRGKAASDWFRVNPHRLHLGIVGFEGISPDEISGISQTLDMWNGVIVSEYRLGDKPVKVSTTCDPDLDMVAFSIDNPALTPVRVRFPYPTGQHSDDASDWSKDELHSTAIVEEGDGFAVLRRNIDAAEYFVRVEWSGDAELVQSGTNAVSIKPASSAWTLTALFCEDKPEGRYVSAEESAKASSDHWKSFWNNGGFVDFGECTDPRAPELERRVLLSQYLLAVNCAGDNPPQETGLTYNSWFGRPHLEMIWWHQSHFPLWGHEDLLDHTLDWYHSVADYAGEIASRQGYEGVRWMKMTDPSGAEAPSNVGSYLIWQQPHLIYLAELLFRAKGDEIIDKYYDLVQKTAVFMASFAQYDAEKDRYVLKGCIPAQETLKASETVNPPFELSYWHFAMGIAQAWRERKGEERIPEWDELITKLSPLASKDGLYLAAESHPQTYEDVTFTSDHPAVLGAYGFLPFTGQLEPQIMSNTLDWILEKWNWNKTWGWDYPLVCMAAARLGRPEDAVNALLMDNRTNTFLVNGHNYQDGRLRLYLPGNGGLLTAVAMMCAGWDGCETKNPGWPDDGTWNVRWEDLSPVF